MLINELKEYQETIVSGAIKCEAKNYCLIFRALIGILERLERLEGLTNGR